MNQSGSDKVLDGCSENGLQAQCESEGNVVIDALFTSVWNHRCKITTKCKINTGTREIFDIEVSDTSVEGTLDEEYVTLPDGTEFEAHNTFFDDVAPGDYWYKD